MSARMGRGIALAALLVVGLTGVAWAQSVTVTLDLTGSGSGTVTSSPAGFSCTGSAHTCTASFAVNTAVTLTATPASGQTLGGWSGACAGTAGCTIVTSTGQLVAAAFNGAAAYVFYHEDAIGSVRAITSEAGATVATHDYQPFGEDVAPLTGDPIRFGGKELDPETGQHYFGARYYRNTLGRFTSVDPGLTTDQARPEPQRWNRYSYTLNNPLKFGDPDGKNPLLIMGAAGAAVFGGWQVYQNVSQGRPWYENVGVEASKGLLIGATLGLAAPTIAAATSATSATVAAAGAPDVEEVAQSTRGGLAPVRLGQEGEAAVRAIRDIGPKEMIEVNGVDRIPDGMTRSVITEIKNVSSLSYTQQLKDFAQFAKVNGMRFELYVRPTTDLSTPLLNAIARGDIYLDYIPEP